MGKTQLAKMSHAGEKMIIPTSLTYAPKLFPVQATAQNFCVGHRNQQQFLHSSHHSDLSVPFSFLMANMTM